MRRSLIIILFILTTTGFYAHAQTQKVRISGRVLDGSTGRPVELATLIVYDSKDSVVFAALIDSKDATFELRDAAVGNGMNRLAFSSGFNLRKDITIDGSGTVRHLNLGDIILEEVLEEINTVTITASAKVERKVGREIYTIDSSFYKGVVNSADIMDKIPLIKVSPTGQSAGIIGKSNVLITVNGIRTGESVDLRRINYRDIEKVEVITLPSSNIDKSYDGVINIVLKKEIRQGFEAGFDEMLRVPSWDSDLYAGFAYGTDKVKVEFLYTNYYRNTKFKTSNTRTDTQSGLTYTMDGISDKGFEMDHTFNLNLDWHVSPDDYFNITTQTDLSRADKHYLYDQVYTDISGDTVFTGSPFRRSLGYSYAIGNYTLHYRHTLKNKRSDWFAITGNAGFTKGYDDSRTVYEDDVRNIRSKENSDRVSASLVFDYHGEFGDILSIDAGAQGFWRNLHSNINNRSETFNDYTNYRYNIFVDFSLDWKKFGIRLGLKGEGNTDIYRKDTYGSRTILSFQPTVGLIWKFDSKNSIQASYLKRNGYPSAWMMAPYDIVYDDKTVLVGNSELRPSRMHTVSVRYSYQGETVQLSTGPDYHHTDDLVTAYQTLDSDLGTLRTYINGTTADRLAYVLGGTVSIGDWMDIDPSVIIFYDWNNVFGNRRQGFYYTLELSLNIFLPYNITLYTGASYQSKSISMTGYNLASYGISTVNLRKNFPSTGMSLTLSYWQPLTSPSRSIQYFDGFEVADYLYRTNSSAFMVRFEWYISGKKQLKRSNVRTYFDTDARSR